MFRHPGPSYLGSNILLSRKKNGVKGFSQLCMKINQDKPQVFHWGRRGEVVMHTNSTDRKGRYKPMFRVTVILFISNQTVSAGAWCPFQLQGMQCLDIAGVLAKMWKL